MISKYRFTQAYVDYHQFHLQDSNAPKGSLGDAWTDEAQARDVAVAPFIVGVGTERNASVWLDLEVHDTKPELKITKNLRRVVECSLDLPSGKLIITCPAEPGGHQVLLTPSCYRLRVHFGKLSERGVHRYKVLMWQEASAPVSRIEVKPSKLTRV
jgi:hypothetical protein